MTTPELPLAELLLTAMLSAVDEGSCSYVAGPLATGRKYYELSAAGAFDAELLRSENENAMREFVRSLRSKSLTPVVDSGRLRVSQWTGAEHGDFFLEVIRTLCKEVVFMDGWNFSSGATKEFVFSQRAGISCVDAQGLRLAVSRGRSLIVEASEYVATLGQSGEVFERRLRAIDELVR
jgi:hypothetical protein